MGLLDAKTVLITGAGNGIGRECALCGTQSRKSEQPVGKPLPTSNQSPISQRQRGWSNRLAMFSVVRTPSFTRPGSSVVQLPRT